VAIVVVGNDELWESEGRDRKTITLPGRQDELVERVAAVNGKTVVVVNAGCPMDLPWAEKVAAVIYAWLPGQEFGHALADVLLGTAEPGGRLPVTLARRPPTTPPTTLPRPDDELTYREASTSDTAASMPPEWSRASPSGTASVTPRSSTSH